MTQGLEPIGGVTGNKMQTHSAELCQSASSRELAFLALELYKPVSWLLVKDAVDHKCAVDLEHEPQSKTEHR